MIVEVNYRRSNTAQPEGQNYRISKLGIIKHMAFAGQGKGFCLNKLMRTIGMLFHYNLYLNNQKLQNNKFSVPPDALYNPTEKGQFSNIIGVAMADYLCKQIDDVIYSRCYESIMKENGLKIGGTTRPDLIAVNKDKKLLSIEAKGYSGGPGNMEKHKEQSRSIEEIPVSSNIACVSYHLYDHLKVNYFDPENDSYENNGEIIKKLTRLYYSDISTYLNEDYFEITDVKINDKNYYVLHPKYKKIFKNSHVYWNFVRMFEYIIDYVFIIDKQVDLVKKTGDIDKLEINKIIDELNKNEWIYIDKDGTGIAHRDSLIKYVATSE